MVVIIIVALLIIGIKVLFKAAGVFIRIVVAPIFVIGVGVMIYAAFNNDTAGVVDSGDTYIEDSVEDGDVEEGEDGQDVKQAMTHIQKMLL